MVAIAIIVFTVSFILLVRDSLKQSDKTRADRALELYGTNAAYEREVLNGFILQGYSFDEAYEKTVQHLMSFYTPIAPCIPKEAYHTWPDSSKFRNPRQKFDDTCFGSYVSNPWQFNNSITNNRIYMLEKQGIEPTFDNLRYNVPRTPKQLDRLYDTAGYLAERMPKGTRFTYPDIGLCEVVDYDDNPAMQKGHYIVKPLEHPAQTIKIEVGDPSIRRWTS